MEYVTFRNYDDAYVALGPNRDDKEGDRARWRYAKNRRGELIEAAAGRCCRPRGRSDRGWGDCCRL